MARFILSSLVLVSLACICQTTAFSLEASPKTAIRDPAIATSPIGTCECGKKQIARIVGGTEAPKNSIPWQVRLITHNAQSVTFLCGGTVISPNYVLTAAHCFEGIVKVTVFLGDHNNQETDTFEKEMESTSFIVHEGYSSDTNDNDIALIKLPSPVQYSNGIQPACLPFVYHQETFVGEKSTVSGWGAIATGGSTSSVLLQVDVNVVSNEVCQKSGYGSITDNMVCASASGKDSCQGDSGGPLTIASADPNAANEQLTYLIGVVSFGKDCADPQFPGVYARVTRYLDWIKQKTGETYCVR